MYGKISIEWHISGKEIFIDIAVPHNTTAHVILPKASPEFIKGSKASFVPCAKGAETELGSGSYSFSYVYDKKQ
jgi:hypothetical protein